MLFNTATYWIFLIIVFIVYWWLNKRSRINLRNGFLLLASYYFYGSWDERFLLLIIASSLIDFLCGRKIAASKNKKVRKLFLSISILANIGMLGFFKYFNFFIDSFVDFIAVFGFAANVSTLSIILPVGISFYTFQTLSYTIDIYKGKLHPVRNPLTFFTFVAFFPQLVAGPIERASNLLPQISRKQKFDKEEAVSGIRFILWGLFKKMVIADRLSYVVDQVYSDPANYTGLGMLVATLFFGIQIYCDFSGYSDIAIGSARLLGIRLMDNFRTPYFSSSFREFWQRWHISLSTWFRDYVYIPLGGNRNGKYRAYFNLMLTFVVSGLWHGANYTFLIWGFLHGTFLILEKSIGRRWSLFPKGLRIPLVFLMVNLFWVFFRASDLNQALFVFQRIFGFSSSGDSLMDFFTGSNFETGLSLLVGGIVFVVVEALIGKKDCNTFFSAINRPHRQVVYYILLLLILIFGVLDTAPQFIYFQF